MLFAYYQFFWINIQYLCYLEEDFEAWLAAVADIGIHYAEAFAKPLCKPSLFNPSLLEDLFYAVHGFIHFVIIYDCILKPRR